MLLILDQLLKALPHDLFQLDTPRHQRRNVQPSIGDKRDHVSELAVIGQRAEYLFFRRHQLEKVELAGLLEDPHQDALAGLADQVDCELGRVFVTDAFEADIRAEPAREAADFGQGIALIGIEHMGRWLVHP